MKFTKRFFFILIISALLLTCLFFVNEWLNSRVFLTEYSFSHPEIPKSFHNYKILVISDMHEADFVAQISRHIKICKPDIVVVTGDMAQLPDTSVEKTCRIKESIGDIPMYAVSGNHDTQGGEYSLIHKTLKNAGIQMLDDTSVCIEKGGESILLTGIKDPVEDNVSDEKIEKIHRKIKNNHPNGPCFSVLLFHRADLYPKIRTFGADLILSGHMHGGIARIPFVGGIVGKGNDKSRFPVYDSGVFHSESDASMIVSRGCDKNKAKKRYLNPPEVLLVTLESTQK